ncbi:protein mono-ADP-ribosyltransferase PARP12 [Patella vulgata]|uniref:protein mono-ADP-ribosyltransferase PARP12 n=1 Tax=Patella vulgata TaxID=6465 RepID=UPI00218054C8|nr:protein mono-ADP-ribosyltransferase PARP12 [Patella vulgata]
MANSVLLKSIIRCIIQYGLNDHDNGMFIDIKGLQFCLKSAVNPSFFNRYRQFFRVSDDKYDVFLVVRAQLCPNFCSTNGCNDFYCQMFHICKFYMLSNSCQASETTCRYGHVLQDGGHNETLMRSLMLDSLSMDELRLLFQLAPNRTEAAIPMLCKFYNGGGGCKKGDKCTCLHICRHYIWDTCKFGPRCKRDHNIHSIERSLNRYGIDTSKTPREILNYLKDLYDRVEPHEDDPDSRSGRLSHAAPMSSVGSRSSSRSGPRSARSERPRHFSESSSSQYLHKFDSSANDKPPSRPSSRPSRALRSVSRPRTISSNIPLDVVPNICLFHLRGKCWYKERCRNVHREMLYQWQCADKDGNWQDFPEKTNIDIEKKYCSTDIEEEFYFKWKSKQRDNVTIVKINLNDIEKSDFKVRRLSTVDFTSDTSNFDLPWTTKWLWYWKSETVWIPYGGQDNVGSRADISSADIEKNFLNEKDITMEFKTNSGSPLFPSQSYEIKFHQMIQINKKYGTERKLARRPEFVDETVLEQRIERVKRLKEVQTFSTPPSWKLPSDVDVFSHFKMVQLEESSDEYDEISEIFKSGFPSPVRSGRIKRIERIENGELWRAFCETKGALGRKLKREVEDRRLFHGTESKIVDAIARQGFDCRLAGTKIGALYGKGCYFGKTSKISSDYCDRLGKMFVARVLLGDYTNGHTLFTRPPLKDPSNPCSDLYDSCVDNTIDPKIFILFNNNQVYPEYLVTFQS